MDKSITSLYLYDDVRRLMMRTDPSIYDNRMDNAPMHKRPMKVHKGVDNTLTFRVFQPDRKPVPLCNKKLYGRVMDRETREIVLEKMVWHGEQTGFIQIKLNPHDLSNVPTGTYDLVIMQESQFVHGVGGDPTYDALFTDFESNVAIEILVTEQAQVSPVPSKVIEVPKMPERRHYNNIDGRYESAFYSDAVEGSRLKNHGNGLVTFSTTTQGFTGTLQVYGTLDHTPNADIDKGWFQVDLEDDVKFMTYIDYYGTRYFNLNGNYMWLKFVVIPKDDSDINKFSTILVRS